MVLLLLAAQTENGFPQLHTKQVVFFVFKILMVPVLRFN